MTYYRTKSAAERAAKDVPGAYVICAQKGVYDYAVVWPDSQWD